MPVCTKCAVLLPEDSFVWRNKALRQKQKRCKDCQAQEKKSYYQKNKQIYIDRSRLHTQKTREAIQTHLFNILSSSACVDCGVIDPVIMDFDHRGNKSSEVSTAFQKGWSWQKIQSEIDNCDVRCANCHRRKTAKELRWYKWRLSQNP